MKHINKIPNQVAGKQIVDELLKECWNDVDSIYKNADYLDLCKPLYKTRLQALLLQEQSNYCCYCMKELVNNHTTTLEHIIPHRSKVADFNSYLTWDELISNVIHRDNFDMKSQIIPPAKYPHDIAYHNLIASCDSHIHCNNYRGDRKIQPLIFDVNIETTIEYDKAGNMSCLQYEDDLQKLGLSNSNSPLTLIRMIWCRLAGVVNHINEITPEMVDDIILDLILLFDGTKVIENFTSYPGYRNDVLKYKWFFNYYKHV